MFQVGVWQKLKFVLKKGETVVESFEISLSEGQSDAFLDVNSATVKEHFRFAQNFGFLKMFFRVFLLRL